MLAKVLGAKVEPHPQGLYEIGYFPIFPTRLGRDLFQRAEAMHVFQWHKDGFELPQGATLLASGQRFENQAFSYGKAIVGVQFHPELTPATMLQWTKLGHRRRLPGIDVRELSIAALRKLHKGPGCVRQMDMLRSPKG